MKDVLLERKSRDDAARNYRSRALDENIDVEHLKVVLFDRKLLGGNSRKL